MRFLVVGAGAIGGYFGGRLLEAGRDATFLVRPRRAAELASAGLTIRSRFGDAALPAPPRLLASELNEPFDVVVLSCKAYDLEGAMDLFAPAVGPGTAIMPLLNGMRHIEALDGRFGRDRVLGGWCTISTTLDAQGRVIHLNDIHTLRFGERTAPAPPAPRRSRPPSPASSSTGRSARRSSRRCGRSGRSSRRPPGSPA